MCHELNPYQTDPNLTEPLQLNTTQTECDASGPRTVGFKASVIQRCPLTAIQVDALSYFLLQRRKLISVICVFIVCLKEGQNDQSGFWFIHLVELNLHSEASMLATYEKTRRFYQSVQRYRRLMSSVQ